MRAGDHCDPLSRQLLAGRRARARSAARAVLDRAGAAPAPVGGAAAHPVRRARLLDPAVPGSVDHPADHDHRRAQPQPGRRGRAAGLAAGALHDRRGRRADRRRPLHPAPAVPAHRQSRRARNVRVRRVVHGRRQLGADAGAGPFDRARRVYRRRHAGRQPVPARAGGGCRAVPLGSARAVLPDDRDAARSPRHRRAPAVRAGDGGGVDRRPRPG